MNPNKRGESKCVSKILFLEFQKVPKSSDFWKKTKYEIKSEAYLLITFD